MISKIKLHHLFALSVLGSVLPGASLAADLPSRQVPVIQPIPALSWTGFHVGVNAGYTWSNSTNANFVATQSSPGAFLSAQLVGQLPTTISFGNGSFIGGAQAGYDMQLAGIGAGTVVGVEADIQGLLGNGATGTYDYYGPLNPTFTYAKKRLGYIGTVRGRIGVLATPTLLVYLTGGLAVGNPSVGGGFWTAPGFSWSTNTSRTRAGWALGGGGEWMFMPKLSLKAEYLYYNLGRVTAAPMVSNLGGILSTYTPSARFDGHIIRAGLNYHF